MVGIHQQGEEEEEVKEGMILEELIEEKREEVEGDSMGKDRQIKFQEATIFNMFSKNGTRMARET